MPEFFSQELPGVGVVNQAAINPRNGRVGEYYREKVWLWTPPPPPQPPKLEVVNETSTIVSTSAIPRVEGSYEEIYGEKVWHKYPVDYQMYWMGVDWACKDEIEFQPREVYDPPRKGRRGWNQPRPHQRNRRTHRQPMMYHRRR